MAGLPVVEPAARADHGRSGRLPGRAARRRRWLWRRAWRQVARIGAAVLLAAFTVVTLGMPLGATKLYLFGISVDQQFRTEYLTGSPTVRPCTT